MAGDTVTTSASSLLELALRIGMDPAKANELVELVRESTQHLRQQRRPPVMAPAGAIGESVLSGLMLEHDPTWDPRQRARFVTGMVGGVRRAATILDVDPAQPSRWASGATVPALDQARTLIDLDHVLAHAALVWPDPAVVADWMETPNGHLDGFSPAVWIRLHGSAEVVDALQAEAAGAYA